jgi:hypothetical protein
MTDTLTRTRQQLDMLLATIRSDVDAAAATRAAELDRREADLARAMELATTDAAVAAAWQQAQAAERLRVQQLISLQLEHLAPHCASRVVLQTLSRMVEAPE